MEAKRTFPLFNSHLDLAHSLWERCASPSKFAIDATCGNGHDTLFLASHFENVIALDVQQEAIRATEKRLQEHSKSAHLFCQSHEAFPEMAYSHPIALIVYNLGYLPGTSKTLTTRVETTLKSVRCALELIQPGGVVSITCYPGHEEGAREEEALLKLSRPLSPSTWSVSHIRWENRKLSPSLLLFQKNI